MTNVNQFLIWKHVPGFINIQVNQYGQVRDSGTHLLKAVHINNTYPSVSAKRVGASSQNTIYIHTLVMLAFKGERPVGYHIDHKDGNTENNVISNLHYVTASQNQRNRKDQRMVTYNGVQTVLIEALEDMFGKECVSATKTGYGYKLYQRVMSSIRNGKAFDDAIAFEVNKRGWPKPNNGGV